MKPSSKNEVMNGIVNAYIVQKALDKANNTHYTDTWKILNGADDEIDASLTFDLSEGEWDSVKTYLKANNIAFALCLISYKDGHSQNSFVWYDDEHIYATEMNEIGSVSFHVVDNANKEIVKPTDETSSSILKMLLALENGGANGGGGEVTTKQVFKGGVDILDKPLDVESKATFGSDVEVDGDLTINSTSNLKTKDKSFSYDGDYMRVKTPQYFFMKNSSKVMVFDDARFSIHGGTYDYQYPAVDIHPDMLAIVSDYGSRGNVAEFYKDHMSVYTDKYVSIKYPAPTESTTFATLLDLNALIDVNAQNELVINKANKKATKFVVKGYDTANDNDIEMVSVDNGGGDGLNIAFRASSTNITDFKCLNFQLVQGSEGVYKLGIYTETQADSVDGPWFLSGAGEIALKSDVAKKQSVLYRHTITIYEGNTKDKNSICFTAYTPSNTPIDSIQDLTASVDGSNKLANTDLGCFGVSGTASALVFYNKIHVGTSISNTTLQKATGGSATLASVYTSYTMTDDVTLN